MPQFGFGPGGMSAPTPNVGVPGMSVLASQAAGLGAPNSAAMGAAVPGGRVEVGQSDIDMLLASLGMPGGAPTMGGPPPPAGAMGSPPSGMEAGMGVSPAPMPAPSLAPEVNAPLIGITQPGEDFPQAFRSATGRYPGPRDYEERQFVMTFVRSVNRYPTKFEMLMAMQPAAPRPYDGEPEYEEMPVGQPALG